MTTLSLLKMEGQVCVRCCGCLVQGGSAESSPCWRGTVKSSTLTPRALSAFALRPLPTTKHSSWLSIALDAEDSSPVDVPPGANDHDEDGRVRIIDLVDHAVVADAYPPSRSSGELPGIGRSGILCQIEHRASHALAVRWGDSVQLPKGLALDQEGVTQGRRTQRLAVRKRDRICGSLLGLVVGANIFKLLEGLEDRLPLANREKNRLLLPVLVGDVLWMQRSHDHIRYVGCRPDSTTIDRSS